MTIAEVIQKARMISDRRGVCFDRDVILAKANGEFDNRSEDLIKDIQRSLNYNFQMVVIGREPLDFVKNKTGRAITIIKKDTSNLSLSDDLYGFVSWKPHSAEIQYPSSLNYCKQRFAVMKELSHLLLCTHEEDGLSGANEVITEARNARKEVPRSPEDELTEEAAAFFLALEVLVPWCRRSQVSKIKEHLLSHGAEFS